MATEASGNPADLPFDGFGAVERAATAIGRAEVVAEAGGSVLPDFLVIRQTVAIQGGGADTAISLLLGVDSPSARPARSLHDALLTRTEGRLSVDQLLRSIGDDDFTRTLRPALEATIGEDQHHSPLLRAALAYGCVAATPPVTRESLRVAALLSDLILASEGLTVRNRLSPAQLDAATRSAAVQLERTGAWIEWVRAWCLLVAREAAGAERALRAVVAELGTQRDSVRAQPRVGATDELVLDRVQRVRTFSIREAVAELGLTVPTVGTSIERLEAAGVATELTGQKRDRIWVASPLLRLAAGR